MEIVKYLCEFFFCNFWHFLELLIILATIFGSTIVKVIKSKSKD